MSSMDDYEPLHGADHAPGDEPAGRHEIAEGVVGYLIGLGLAILLTAVSFFIAGTYLVWRPSIPIALVVLAIAQIGVHLVFFLHITTGPGQCEQRPGARVWGSDRFPDPRRVDLDHVQLEPEHGSHADGVAVRLKRLRRPSPDGPRAGRARKASDARHPIAKSQSERQMQRFAGFLNAKRSK